MKYRHSRWAAPRRGATLVLVVAFLALGLSLGISFLYVASNHATRMRMYRESGQGGRAAGVNQGTLGSNDEAPPQPYDIANTALGQLIYDAPDDESGVGTSLRGAGLARSMYGLHYAGGPIVPNYTSNDIAFNGIGRFHSPGGSYVPPLLSGLSDADFRAVNYTYHASDRFVRDPERIGYRTSPRDAVWNVAGVNTTTNHFPINAGYTYPDEKDVCLAAVRASDGRVLVPSFYRPSAFGSLAPSNPNWTNPQGKYLIHRPRPVDMGPGFPAVPANPDGTYTGDIEQLAGKRVRQNDSLWLDLDLPVRKWRGRDYKPLVAFLIVDMDGRINLNVAGNRRGIADQHASHQGWGGWEIDPRQAIPFNEAGRMFTDPAGRYGSNRIPDKVFAPDGIDGSGNVASTRPSPSFFAQIDHDASILTDPSVQTRMQLPQAPSTRTSPIYPPRFANASTAERTDHPALFNPYLLSNSNFVSGDRAFGARELRPLLYHYNGGDSEYRATDLGRLMPMSLGRSCTPGQNGWAANAANPRYLTTTISNDLDRPGLSPWMFDRPQDYILNQPPAQGGVYPPAAQPTGPGVPFPALSQRTATANPTNVTDFDPATWRAARAAIGTVDLSRPLADYRSDPSQPHEQAGNVTAASSARALADRQRLAQDLFDRLCIATGARLSGATPGTPPFNALRYLAQLSVNIVDYLDPDDYTTPFVWNPINPAIPRDAANFTTAELANRVVFGVELHRLIINEACVRVENGSALPNQPDSDPGLVPPAPPPLGWLPRATFYDVKVWAELHNPLTPGLTGAGSLSHGGGAALTYEGNQVYRLLLTAPNQRLRHVDNVKGDPDGAIRKTVNLPAGVYASANDVIPPSNGAYIQARGPNSSFYVIAPENTPGDLVVPSAASDDMKFRIPAAPYQNNNEARVTLLLQRLACPHLPPAADNPYVTTDFLEFTSQMINDARVFNANGLVAPPPLGLVLQRAWGRKQPYAGHPSQVVAQNLIPAPVAGIHHTFFRHNGQGALLSNAGLTLTQPFDWLVHLDRAPISPIELRHVAACRPHELTHQFIIDSLKHQHHADWSSDAARLHRALPLLDVRSQVLGMPAGGRIPGKVNLNTIWDEEVFKALCSADVANYFVASDVTSIWNKLLRVRTPNGVPSAAAGQDRPFRAPGTIDPGSTQHPGGGGVRDSLFRADPMDPNALLFDLPGQSHPYLRTELFNKIMGNLTTRSNVFAVWMTVGYFEVTDRSTRPVRLGQEVGIDDGSNIRHQFFAVVDRTNLTIDPANPRRQGPRPVFFSFEPIPSASGVDPTTPGTVTAVIPASSFDGQVVSGNYDDAAWQLRTGDRLVIDVGARQESVPIQIVGYTNGVGARVRFDCQFPHARGCAMMIANTRLGNPGPQPGFSVGDPRYSGVVRVFGAVN